MCNRFLKYLEKKFSCLSQGENGDSSSDGQSNKDSDRSRHSSESEDDSYQDDSFKSYSEEESAGEDVVMSTGGRGTRSSTYVNRSPKATGSNDENTEAQNPVDQKNKKYSPVENTKKHVKLKVDSSPRKNPEVWGKKSPELEKHRPKQTHEELQRNSFKRERLNQDRNSTKTPTVKDKTDAKQKNDMRTHTAKQDEKATIGKADRLRKSTLKHKRAAKKVNSNRDGKTEAKGEREKKSVQKSDEKPKSEEKKEKAEIPDTPRGNNKKSTLSTHEKVAAPRLSKISSKQTEIGNQTRKPMKSNSSEISTFSKGANKSLPRRSAPTFAPKSIQKRRS